MEFAIDSILQTLLVGAIMSLCITVPIFLFMEHLIRIRVIGKIFRFVLYEDEFHAAQAATDYDDGADQVFVTLLLVAALFGLGIAAESSSDYVTDKLGKIFPSTVFSDPQIRADSFEAVAKSELRSGRINDDLVRLYTDLRACNALVIIKGSPSDPCTITQNRVDDVYYYAKNTVFTHDNYFKELSQIQSRIDFIRTLSHAFLILALELLIGFIAAALVEAIEKLLPLPCFVSASWAKWWRSTSSEPGTCLHHLKNLSAYRLLILCSIIVLIGWAMLATWQDVEARYDKRVFGYFFCCMNVDKSATDTSLASGAAVPVPVTPVSGYRVFEADGVQFEPSAISSLGVHDGVEFFLVVNDKDASHLSLFEYREPPQKQSQKKQKPGGLNFQQPIMLTWPNDISPLDVKLEAIDIQFTWNATQSAWTGLLAGSVRREGLSVPTIFRLKVKKSFANLNGSYQTQDVPADLADLVGSVEELKLSARLCGALDAERELNSKTEKECSIEGIAERIASPDGKIKPLLIVGVRNLSHSPVFALIQLEHNRKGDYEPQQMVLTTAPYFPSAPNHGGDQPEQKKTSLLGISGLDFDPSGNLLVLTSYEYEVDAAHPIDLDKMPAAILQVQGALWRISKTDLEKTPEELTKSIQTLQPLLRFAHKPEGIAVLKTDPHSVIVVFDDDAARKNIELAPATFAERQSEGVFVRTSLVASP